MALGDRSGSGGAHRPVGWHGPRGQAEARGTWVVWVRGVAVGLWAGAGEGQREPWTWGWGTGMGCEGERCVRVGVVISQGPMSRCGQHEGSCMGRHGWAGLVCIPTGVCWRQHGRPTRQATSSGWAQTAGVPRSHLCCTWRRWLRALSLSSPRGCLFEVGPAGPDGAPPALTYHHCQRHP